MKTQARLLPLMVAAVLAGAHAAVPDGSMVPPGAEQSGNPNLLTPVVPPLIIIAPTEVRTHPKLAEECWVRLFPEPDFKGRDDLTIAGPIELPSLHTPAGGVYWKHKAESVLVGPKATIVVYESKSFQDKAATLEPGSQMPQLRKALQFTQSIDSLKITCKR